MLTDRPDLSPAYALRSWVDRGRFVVDELQSVAAASQRTSLDLLNSFGVEHHPFWINNVIQARSRLPAIQAIAGRAEVESIKGDRTFSVDPLPGTVLAPSGTVEWNVAQIGADQVWNNFGDTGQGIVVGTIDIGVEYTHSALLNQYRGNQGSNSFDHNYNWWDSTHTCGPTGTGPCDNVFHGTHTMGTIVGGDGPGPFENDIGVAPGARWIAAKGCESSFCTTFALVSSGQWMLAPTDLYGNNPDPDRRPHIMSNSWGGSPNNPFYQDIVKAWRAAGIFPVFANGNAGSNCGTVGSPGDYPESFGVGATDSLDRIAAFSSRGPSAFGPVKPDASAPGVNVRSSAPGNTYRAASGTSMATPHVAGTVALIWAVAPSLIGDVAATAALIKKTAHDHPDLSCGGDADGDPNNLYGDGRIDALAAVSQATNRFRRGADCMADDSASPLNLTDPIGLLTYLFRGGQQPSCLNACDANDDARADLSDAVYRIAYLFQHGPAPSAPFPDCDLDPTPDALSCESETVCR
jgi:hypothetical protein